MIERSIGSDTSLRVYQKSAMQAETPPRRGAPNLPYYLVILLATLRSDSQLYDHVHGALYDAPAALVRPAPPARPPFRPPSCAIYRGS